MVGSIRSSTNFSGAAGLFQHLDFTLKISTSEQRQQALQCKHLFQLCLSWPGDLHDQTLQVVGNGFIFVDNRPVQL